MLRGVCTLYGMVLINTSAGFRDYEPRIHRDFEFDVQNTSVLY